MTRAAHATVGAGRRASAPAASLYILLSRLERQGVRRAVVALAFALMLPALWSGLSLDDYVLRDELAQPENTVYSGRSVLDLFRWTEPGSVDRLIDGGGVSWWIPRNTRVAFMRPLSSLTHALDHLLWPDSALLMHVHNLLWFGLLLAVTFGAYRALVARAWSLGLACAMFALDSAHAGPVGWIANRNGLISATFAVACMLCHHRARSATLARERLCWALLAAAAFVTSLLGAELGVGIFGYLLAYAVLYEVGPLRARLASLAPYVLGLGAFGLARARLGYGVIGGFGNYIDPTQEPLRFLRMVPVRATMLISSQLSRFCSDLYEVTLPPVSAYMLAIAIGLLLLALWLIAPVLRADRTSRFFFAGAVLAAIPPVGSTASERLLLLVGFGVPPVLAEAVRRALIAPVRVRFTSGAAAQRSLRHALAGMFLIAHLVIDPLLMPLYATIPGLLGREAEKISDQLALAPGRPRTVIVASIPDPSPLYYAQVIRRVRAQPQPERLYWLAGMSEGTRYTRRGPRSLRVTNPAGFWDVRWEERSPELPLRVGDRIELTELSVSVVEVTADGRPCAVDFTFREPLESERYAWLDWRDGKLERFAPPQLHARDYRAAERGPRAGARGDLALR